MANSFDVIKYENSDLFFYSFSAHCILVYSLAGHLSISNKFFDILADLKSSILILTSDFFYFSFFNLILLKGARHL